MKHLTFLLVSMGLFSCQQATDNRTLHFPNTRDGVTEIPDKNNTWVFIMAGQSNMAGRGLVEPGDTVPNPRILSIDSTGRLVYAKEPLHFYEPIRTGLDCGLSFGKTLLESIPDTLSVLILPVAVGGSSMQQWLGDSLYRGVKLLSNFKEKVAIGTKYGEIKAILWHQGESDANEKSIDAYPARLPRLMSTFRSIVQNDSLPILMGELGSYSNDDHYWQMVNSAIHAYAQTDENTSVIGTQDFVHKGDSIHFNSEGQREMGKRFARAYLEMSSTIQ